MAEEDKAPERLSTAALAWEKGAPRSRAFDDVYFSGDGAAEAEHVFLAGSDLEARFRTASRFSIGELGFGTGLNFLKAWALWERAAKPGARLVYLSLEKFPLDTDDLARAHAAWPDLADRAARLRAVLPPPVAGLHTIDVAPGVTLMLGLGDAGEMLARIEAQIDAWFLDGFAPAKNPGMWSADLFKEIARDSAPGATVATFTVAGDVRRALGQAGFAVEKRPGFGRKREMLTARIETPARRSRRAPWFDNARPHRLGAGASFGIIGGGIAGASLAHAAKKAGLVPAIIEETSLAAGASGNPAGLIMPRLDLGDSPAARFFLLAYLHTVRLLSELESGIFNPCGVLLGAKNDDEKRRRRKIIEARLLPEKWIEARSDGLFFPQAGVVDPKAFVAALAGDIEIVRARALQINYEDETPVVLLDSGAARGFDAVVIANGLEALKFDAARTLPFVPVAGQIDWFPDETAIPHALAFGPYAAPAPPFDEEGGGLVIGATYEKLDPGEAPSPSRRATDENIAAVARFAPEIAARLRPEQSRPRASLRCQTPDRLPVAGPLPDIDYYGAVYDDLRLGAKRDYPPAETLPGVFILSGLGSRGLVAAPFAAAMIVAEMTGAPVDAEIAQILHPARFFIRDLKRAVTVRKD